MKYAPPTDRRQRDADRDADHGVDQSELQHLEHPLTSAPMLRTDAEHALLRIGEQRQGQTTQHHEDERDQPLPDRARRGGRRAEDRVAVAAERRPPTPAQRRDIQQAVPQPAAHRSTRTAPARCDANGCRSRPACSSERPSLRTRQRDRLHQTESDDGQHGDAEHVRQPVVHGSSVRSAPSGPVGPQRSTRTTDGGVRDGVGFRDRARVRGQVGVDAPVRPRRDHPAGDAGRSLAHAGGPRRFQADHRSAEGRSAPPGSVGRAPSARHGRPRLRTGQARPDARDPRPVRVCARASSATTHPTAATPS